MRHFLRHRNTRRTAVALGAVAASLAWSGTADAVACHAEVVDGPFIHDLACMVYGTGAGSCLFDEESGQFWEVIVRCDTVAVVTVRAD